MSTKRGFVYKREGCKTPQYDNPTYYTTSSDLGLQGDLTRTFFG